MQMTLDQKIEVARWICDKNAHMRISGSILMNYLGIDIGREPNDIDLIYIYYDPLDKDSLILPPLTQELEVEVSDDGYVVLCRYEFLGVKIEVLHSPDESSYPDFDKFDDYAFISSLEALIDRKKLYIDNGSKDADKHKRDLDAIYSWLEFHKNNIPDNPLYRGII